MASVTYGKDIMASVIMAKILWQMKQSLSEISSLVSNSVSLKWFIISARIVLQNELKSRPNLYSSSICCKDKIRVKKSAFEACFQLLENKLRVTNSYLSRKWSVLYLNHFLMNWPTWIYCIYNTVRPIQLWNNKTTVRLKMWF